jgi:hypothetical protein
MARHRLFGPRRLGFRDTESPQVPPKEQAPFKEAVMTARLFAAGPLLAGLLIAMPAVAQQAGSQSRSSDFAGQWAARPGGQAGVEIRVTGRRIEARELFQTSQAGGTCGTVGSGQVNGATAQMRFQGRCSDGRTTPATQCTVRLESRDQVTTTCRNGHQAVLHRVR